MHLDAVLVPPYAPGMPFHPIAVMLAVLGGVAALFATLWAAALRRLGRGGAAEDAARRPAVPSGTQVLTGSLTMFFDTLGIGSFATTTALVRALRMAPDELIPGTLNAGHSLASVLQAFIYTALIPVDAVTLILMVVASTAGAWLGAGLVARWPRRRIQAWMGAALLAAACLMLPKLLNLLPPGGEAIGLAGWKLAVAVGGNFLLGALMTLGIGLFAPCMIMLSLLGMSPKAIFPIMMASCAFVMPVGGLRFIQARSYSPRLALGLTLGGIPAVLAAAFLVKEMPLLVLRWMVLVVVVVTGMMMLAAAAGRDAGRKDAPTSPETASSRTELPERPQVGSGAGKPA